MKDMTATYNKDKFTWLVLAGILFLALGLFLRIPAAWAAMTPPDLSKKGEIQLTMKQGNTPVPGGTLTVIQVGKIAVNGGDFSYVPTDDFARGGFSFSDLEAEGLPAQLYEYAVGHKLVGEVAPINNEGFVSFKDKELGVYLAVQEEAAPGYCAIAPFLMTLPYREGDNWVYTLDATPKTEAVPLPPYQLPSKPPISTLPQTGQLNWPISLLAFGGVVLLAVGWLLRASSRKQSIE